MKSIKLILFLFLLVLPLTSCKNKDIIESLIPEDIISETTELEESEPLHTIGFKVIPDDSTIIFDNQYYIRTSIEDLPPYYNRTPSMTYTLFDPNDNLIGEIVNHTPYLSFRMDQAEYAYTIADKEDVESTIVFVNGFYHTHYDFKNQSLYDEIKYSDDMIEEHDLAISSDGRFEIARVKGMIGPNGYPITHVITIDKETDKMTYLCDNYPSIIFGSGYTLFVNEYGKLWLSDVSKTDSQIEIEIPKHLLPNEITYDKDNDLFLVIATTIDKSHDYLDEIPTPVELIVLNSQGQIQKNIKTDLLIVPYDNRTHRTIIFTMKDGGHILIRDNSGNSEEVFYL